MLATGAQQAQVLDLRPGELVRVRSATEILDTLDPRGALDGVPFMPEMLKYCGRTLPVAQRADKTCAGDGAPRRMHDTVHLRNVRCDGSAHGGCQAACLMYWKEAWLERVANGAMSPPGSASPDEGSPIDDFLASATTTEATRGTSGATVYRCQATEVPRASTPLRFREIDQYRRDLQNWSSRKVLRGLVIALANTCKRLVERHLPQSMRIAGGRPYPFVDGTLAKGKTPAAKLDLKPGDLVRIKSKEEIVATLDSGNFNRGLSFDVEMVKYCGRTARVLARVNRLIEEKTGEMIEIKSDCIILDGVTCVADYHLFCTRAIYPYWREIWLEKISHAEAGDGLPAAGRDCAEQPRRRCEGS